MNNLALLYMRRDNYNLADHPDTLASMNNLAVLYKRQQKYNVAESLYTLRWLVSLHKNREMAGWVVTADDDGDI
jgi:hypothetical protein